MRTAIAAVATALLILTEPSCGSKPKAEPSPSRSLSPVVQALIDLPIPPPPPNLPPPNGRGGALEVTFAIEVFDHSFTTRLEKRVGVQAVAWRPNGQLVTVTDPETGRTNPWVDLREISTHGPKHLGPKLYIHRLDPGIVAVSVTVVYPMGHVGEFLSCQVIVHGNRIEGPTTDVLVQVQPIPGRQDGIGGLTIVTCTYIDSSRG